MLREKKVFDSFWKKKISTNYTVWIAQKTDSGYRLVVSNSPVFGWPDLSYEITTTCIDGHEGGVQISEIEFNQAYRKALSYLRKLNICKAD